MEVEIPDEFKDFQDHRMSMDASAEEWNAWERTKDRYGEAIETASRQVVMKEPGPSNLKMLRVDLDLYRDGSRTEWLGNWKDVGE